MSFKRYDKYVYGKDFHDNLNKGHGISLSKREKFLVILSLCNSVVVVCYKCNNLLKINIFRTRRNLQMFLFFYCRIGIPGQNLYKKKYEREPKILTTQ